MACQGTLQLEWLRFWYLIERSRRIHLLKIFDFPNLGCMVCAAGCEVLDVWGEENSSDILPVSFEVCDWNQSSFLAVLD
jgi:hypothetical protein